MSRNSLVLEKSAPPVLSAGSGVYLDLIRRLFHAHSVVAVTPGARVCRGIAAELAAAGKRVVIVAVGEVLRTDRLPGPSATLPGRDPNVYCWPSAAGSPVEFFKQSPEPPSPSGNWLDLLRRSFDCVLLDCPSLETAPAAASIAASADAAVLVVEAGRTTRQQIQHDQRTLELAGIQPAGCILIQRR